MKAYIKLFMQAFDTGHWSLWNGNNWTPVLCRGAMYWAIVNWHEEPVLARRVVRAVVDVEKLHEPMILADGVYAEGVCQYSYMSVDAQLAIAALYAQAFGQPFPSIDVVALQKLARWQLAAHETTGYAVNFGDSHNCRGTNTATLYAALAPEIVSSDMDPALAVISPCTARSWATTAYYFTAYNPVFFYLLLMPSCPL